MSSARFFIAAGLVMGGVGLLSSGAQAAQITISSNVGGFNRAPFGDTTALGVNRIRAEGFNIDLGNNNLLRGTVQVGNSTSEGRQILTLVFTDMTLSSSLSQTLQVQVNIVQDFVLDDLASEFGTGSHQFNGRVNYSHAGQLASLQQQAVHESTALPVNWFNQAGMLSAGPTLPPGETVSQGDGGFTPIAVTGPVYTINATYLFTLNAGDALGGVVSIVLPDSGVDNASLVLIPLPPAAGMGLAGLALAAGVGAIRRRRTLRERA